MTEAEYIQKIVASKLLKKSKTDWMNHITVSGNKIVFGNEMLIARIVAKEINNEASYTIKGEESEVINGKGFQLVQLITEQAQKANRLLSFAVKVDEFKKEISAIKRFTGADKISMLFEETLHLFYMSDDQSLKVKKAYPGLINYQVTSHDRMIDVDLYMKILNLFESFGEEQISIFHFDHPIPILFKGQQLAVYGMYPKNDYMYFLEGKWF